MTTLGYDDFNQNLLYFETVSEATERILYLRDSKWEYLLHMNGTYGLTKLRAFGMAFMELGQ